MLILRKDKYISAAPRCTCLPPHQHCTEVALGGKQVHLGCASMYLSSSSCNFSSSPPRPSPGTTRLRLVVPGLGLGGLEWSLWWPPRTTSAQVHHGQVQVQLGFASLYLGGGEGETVAQMVAVFHGLCTITVAPKIYHIFFCAGASLGAVLMQC